MPNYLFKNIETGDLEEHPMRISELDVFKANNPHLERYIDGAPILSDGQRMNVAGIGKPDSTFEKYVINRIKETVPGNTVKSGHKTKMPREW